MNSAHSQEPDPKRQPDSHAAAETAPHEAPVTRRKPGVKVRSPFADAGATAGGSAADAGETMALPTAPVLWIHDVAADEVEAMEAAAGEPGGMRMGEFLIQQGILKPEEVEQIVQYQQQHRVRFGSAAIALRLLSQNQLSWALSRQYQYAVANANSLLQQYPIASAPESAQAEAIRSIRTELLLKLPADGPHVLAVMSMHRADPRTYLAASLALAFAQSEFRTLLINADLRAPETQSLLGTPADGGLSGILRSRSTHQVYQPVPDFPLLYSIVAGPQPPNPSELLREPALRALLARAGRKFDVIIVNTPPIEEAADAQLIASQVDHSILLVSQDTTTISEVRKAQALLKSAGSQLIGMVYQQGIAPEGKFRRWCQRWLRFSPAGKKDSVR